jgi:uncharacterized protein (TIGR02231 family)
MSLTIALLLLSAPASSAVDRVTVLADRAEVVRVATTRCRDGRASATFSGLPLALDVRTLAPIARAPARAIGTTSREISTAVDDRSRERARVDEELRRIDLQLRGLDDEARTLDERVAQLAAYARHVDPLVREDMRSAKPQLDAWRRSVDQLARDEVSARRAQAALAPRRRALEATRERLAAERDRLGGADERVTREVEVAVDCGGAIEARVELGYVVPGARWYPEYGVYFTPSGPAKTGRGQVEILVAAQVAQATGEDWSDVELVLSTAKPRLGTEAPLPAAIVVDGRPASAEKVVIAGSEDRSSLSAGSGASGAPPSVARLEDGGRAFTLRFPGRATVRADGRPYWLPLDTVTTTGEAKLVAVPKLSPYVFRAITLENPARYPLMAGRARLHRGGSFVGEVPLPHTGPGVPLELSLGVDGELRVERAELGDLDRSPGFLSSTRRIERRLEIMLANQGQGAEKVELRENVPVSKDEALRVTLDAAATTPGFSHDALRGIYTWRVELAPGASKKIRLGYTIALPESWKVR